ncbi:hypothetical protein Dda_2894 [Drechslerella dactyloides]|uniref:Uncharacterized protein n=1 Tax=Drechslerella dactyloides TaxID=74499 RepID=A0AAD6NKR5_DREDA|nr:hypothetical protein Dda_2894 [Drechslerella dactyloides]
MDDDRIVSSLRRAMWSPEAAVELLSNGQFGVAGSVELVANDALTEVGHGRLETAHDPSRITRWQLERCRRIDGGMLSQQRRQGPPADSNFFFFHGRSLVRHGSIKVRDNQPTANKNPRTAQSNCSNWSTVAKLPDAYRFQFPGKRPHQGTFAVAPRKRAHSAPRTVRLPPNSNGDVTPTVLGTTADIHVLLSHELVLMSDSRWHLRVRKVRARQLATALT